MLFDHLWDLFFSDHHHHLGMTPCFKTHLPLDNLNLLNHQQPTSFQEVGHHIKVHHHHATSFARKNGHVMAKFGKKDGGAGGSERPAEVIPLLYRDGPGELPPYLLSSLVRSQ